MHVVRRRAVKCIISVSGRGVLGSVHLRLNGIELGDKWKHRNRPAKQGRCGLEFTVLSRRGDANVWDSYLGHGFLEVLRTVLDDVRMPL